MSLDRIERMASRIDRIEKLANDNRKLLVVAIVSNLPTLLEAIQNLIG